MEFRDLFLNEGCISYDSDSSASHPNVSKLYVWNLRLEALIWLEQHMCRWQLLVRPRRPPKNAHDRRPPAPPPLSCFCIDSHEVCITKLQSKRHWTLAYDSFRHVKGKFKTWIRFLFLLMTDLVLNWILCCFVTKKKASLLPIFLVDPMKSTKNKTIWQIKIVFHEEQRGF